MPTQQSIIQARYDAKNSKIYSLKFNRKYDADIIEKLDNVDSRNGYIKQLIREDLARTRIESAPDSVPESAPKSTPETEREGKQMKTYHIKPEYLDMWEGNDTPSVPDRIITEEQVEEFAKEWDKSVPELLDQLIEID